MTVGKFFVSVYVPTRLLGRSPRTVQQYADAIRQFHQVCGSVDIASLQESILADFARHFLQKQCSPATANANLRPLKAIWRFAAARGFCAPPPVIPSLPELKRIPCAWTPDDIGRLLESSSKETGLIGSVAAAPFWRAFILTCYDTGLRRGVLLCLPMRCIDFANRWILAPAELQKTRGDQLVRVSAETAAALAAIRDPAERSFAFPWPYDRYDRTTWTAFSRRMRKIVRRAGLDLAHKHCQRIRRTRASLGEAVERGSAWIDMGHSSPAITRDHYLDPRLAWPSTVVDRLPRPQAPPQC